IPSGAWHSTAGVDCRDSISVNLSYQDGTFRDFLLACFGQILDGSSFMQECPISLGGDLNGMSPETETFLMARFAEVAERVASFGRADLDHLWNQCIARNIVPQPTRSRFRRIPRPRRGDLFQIYPGST